MESTAAATPNPPRRPSFWQQRSSTEQSLIVSVGLVSIIAVVFFITLVVLLVHPVANGANSRRSGTDLDNAVDVDICTNPECIHQASNLLSNIDENVDPCDDFYNFACGSFIKKSWTPDDDARLDQFTINSDKVRERISSLLEEPIKPNELRPFILAKSLYQACMNVTAIEARGPQPLLDLLRNLGDWPVLNGDSWKESSFSWKDTVYRCRDIGLPEISFLKFSVVVDEKNNTKRIIELDQAPLGLRQEHLSHHSSDKLKEVYYKYMVHVAKLLGAEKSRAEVELKESLHFEIKLANIFVLQDYNNPNKRYNPMTIAQLTRKFPSIPWLEYINRMLSPYVIVGPEEIIIVRVPEYIANLGNLLNRTPKRVQANYMMWHVAKSSIPFLTEALRDHELHYHKALIDQTKHQSRWKECTDIISTRKNFYESADGRMSLAVGSLYIRKYLDEKTRAKVLEMIKEIRQQQRKTLIEAEWMDNQTRKAALEKVDHIALLIAYPREMLNDTNLANFYSRLELSSDKLLESILNMSLFETNNMVKMLREPVNKNDWTSHGGFVTVNAYYNFNENSIQIPAGILQGTFFSAERPAYLNYGAIGSFIGHEISHVVDSLGRYYDKNGNSFDWWQEQSQQNYLEKSKCITDQYSNYTVPEVGAKLNATIMLPEIIADNTGTREAYYAYQAWTKRHGHEPHLPGLEQYSPEQLFWISAANAWCAVISNELIRVVITRYPTHHLRVIGIISNMKEFAEDFKCPANSKMNPQKKCNLW